MKILSNIIKLIDNNIYQSNILDNLTDNLGFSITIPLKDFDFSKNLSNLSIKELREFIIFWDYMNSDKYFVLGIVK